jgi:hypothetical protein
MKATIDIPDELYRQVKAKSALRGQPVREVAVSLFQHWISEVRETPIEESDMPAKQPIPDWYGSARKYAQRVRRHDMESVRGSIARGRAGEVGP